MTIGSTLRQQTRFNEALNIYNKINLNDIKECYDLVAKLHRKKGIFIISIGKWILPLFILFFNPILINESNISIDDKILLAIYINLNMIELKNTF